MTRPVRGSAALLFSLSCEIRLASRFWKASSLPAHARARALRMTGRIMDHSNYPKVWCCKHLFKKYYGGETWIQKNRTIY